MSMSKGFCFFELEEGWEDICKNIYRIKEQYGLPFYLFSVEKARRNMDELCENFGADVKLAYAMKANPWILKGIEDKADYIEACSLGELELCREYGIDSGKIVLDGPFKNDDLLNQAIDMGIGRISIDSIEQLERYMSVLAGRQGPELFLRVGSGNQFGMDESEIAECIRKYSAVYDKISIGIQYYSGTQKRSRCQIEGDMERLRRWLSFCENTFQGVVRKIEFGFGTGVPYFIGEEIREYEEAMEAAISFVKELGKDYEITYEVGRCVAASCGIYVTEVFQEKKREDKTILFCRGGTNHLRYHGGALGIREPHVQGFCSVPRNEKKEYMICGSMCNAGDILARNCRMDAGMKTGDIIIFYGTGAYSPVECANLFLAMEMSAILVYNKKNGSLSEQILKVRGSIPTYGLINSGCEN